MESWSYAEVWNYAMRTCNCQHLDPISSLQLFSPDFDIGFDRSETLTCIVVVFNLQPCLRYVRFGKLNLYVAML